MKCFKPDGCTNTCEPVDPAVAPIFDLFLSTQSLWNVNEWSGVRQRLDRSELAIEASLRGYELTEFDLDALAVMERVLRTYDMKLRSQENPNRG